MCIDIVEIWFVNVDGQISSFWWSYLPETSIFSFPDGNLSKYHWIFTEFGKFIDIVEIWFGIANGQNSSIFDKVNCKRHVMAKYYRFTFLLA